VPALTINAVCGSGLKAVMLAAQAIATGDSEIVVAGGQESMSLAPHVLPNSRNGQRMGDWKLVDTMIVDGLWDVYNQYHMGITAENVAKKYEIRPRRAGRIGAGQPEKAAAAQDAGKFKDEITPSPSRRRRATRSSSTGRVHQQASPAPKPWPRCVPPSTRPARDGRQCLGHQRRGGRRGRDVGQEGRGTRPHAAGRIASYATAGLDPAIMGMGPVPASTKALQRAGWKAADLDLLEINEAFAAQACAVNKRDGLGPRAGQRERRRHRHRPPDRRVRLPHPGDAAARDAAPRGQEGHGLAVHRRRHGRGIDDRALSAAPAGGASPIVIDTNIVLDLLVFDDPLWVPLRAALAAGELRWLATAAMRDELLRVLGYPLIARRLQKDARQADAVMAAFDAQVHAVADVPPRARFVCKDPDDQIFIDLAVAQTARLLSKDQAVLSMRKRLATLGVAVAPLYDASADSVGIPAP
jgi:predicted nucleic acid-binding protein